MFLGPETDTLYQFLDPEIFKISQYLFKLMFLIPIELFHNPNQVQIVFFFFYWPEFWKKLLGPETDEMCQFLGPETDP